MCIGCLDFSREKDNVLFQHHSSVSAASGGLVWAACFFCHHMTTWLVSITQAKPSKLCVSVGVLKRNDVSFSCRLVVNYIADVSTSN